MKYFLIILVFLVGCSSVGTFHYTVPKGKHRSTNILREVHNHTLRYSFTTDSTWIWDKPDKQGWSKVTGMSWNSNKKNSVRIVYLRLSDSVGVLGYYYYVNGVSPQDNPTQKGILDTISIGQSYYGKLGWDNGFYFIEMNNKYHSMYVGDVIPTFYFRWLQNPYIGGTYVIDHDWDMITTIR